MGNKLEFQTRESKPIRDQPLPEITDQGTTLTAATANYKDTVRRLTEEESRKRNSARMHRVEHIGQMYSSQINQKEV